MRKWFKKYQESLKFIAILFIIWRIILLAIAFVGTKYFPIKTDYLGENIWANFDGVHYLKIARQGYLQFLQAFFPFYPFLIRWLNQWLNNYLMSGLLISHISLLIALLIFYKLVKLDFGHKIAKRSLIFLLLFPTAFFLGSLYTESLFLALILGSFYAARKKHWWLAGILGAFASATRLVGIFLFPALLIEWYESQVKNSKLPSKGGSAYGGKIQNLLPLFLITSGLLFYMWYLKKTTGDPLYFMHMLSIFGPQRTSGRFILLYQVFWRYWKMILTTRMDILYFTVWLELLTSLLFLILALISYFRLRLSYFVFTILAYLTPTLTGSFSSMPRYVLVLFPGFIILAIMAEKYRWLKIVYPIVSGILLIVSTILFIRGFWVA